MDWKDRLSSLILGEESKKKITEPLGKRRVQGEVPYDMENDTAATMGAGGRGFQRRSRGRGREVSDLGSMASLKSTSTQGVPSDSRSGPLGRREGPLAKVLKNALSNK